MASGILFGLAPALRVARVDMLTTLKDSDRGSAGASAMWGRGNNLRRLLVIAELSISVVVLIMAGLLLRSFILLQRVDPGFNAQQCFNGGAYAERRQVQRSKSSSRHLSPVFR